MEQKESLAQYDFNITWTLHDGTTIEFLWNIISKENPNESYIEIWYIQAWNYIKTIIWPTTTEKIDTEEEFALFQIFSRFSLENPIWEYTKNNNIKEFLSRKFCIHLKSIHIDKKNSLEHIYQKYGSDLKTLLNQAISMGLASEVWISLQEFVTEVKKLVELQNISKPSLIRYSDQELEKKYYHSMVIVWKNEDWSKTLLWNISYEPSSYTCLPDNINVATSGTLILHPYLRGVWLGKELLNKSQLYFEKKYDVIIWATFNPIVYSTKLQQWYTAIKSMPAKDYLIPAMNQFYQELWKEPFDFINVQSYIKFSSRVSQDIIDILGNEFEYFKWAAIVLQQQIEENRKISFTYLENFPNDTI